MNHIQMIKQYLAETKIMQLATVADGKPWVCTLHFVADKNANIYWLSLPTRRHSDEIAKNPNSAAAIAVKTDMPVIGVQVEGMAEMVTDIETITRVMDLYVASHGTGKTFVDRVVQGIDNHKLYKLIPARIQLFDEVNFSKQPPKEWIL